MKRRGFTLIELVVAVSISAVVAGTVITTLVRQQRFYASAEERLETRARLRDATEVLASELRGGAVSELGLPLMTDTAVELYTAIATSIACTITGSTVGLPPMSLSRGNTLTSMLAIPDTGDIALVYANPYSNPDSGHWEQHRISAFTTKAASSTCPATSNFTRPIDVAAGTTGWQLTLAVAPGIDVHQGAPIHFVRRGRYSLYKSSDGDWYLGYRRCNALGASTCGSVQPVSGSYHSYSRGTASGGLGFQYFDKAGSPVVPAQSASVARVRISAESALLHHPDWRTSSLAAESVAAIVSPRNRAR